METDHTGMRLRAGNAQGLIALMVVALVAVSAPPLDAGATSGRPGVTARAEIARFRERISTDSGSVRASGSSTPPAVSRSVDGDGDGIFDDLERRLKQLDEGKRAKVIVHTDRPVTPELIRGHRSTVGKLRVERRFRHVHGYAARLRPAQARRLAERGDVVHVETNARVRATLDSATGEFGVDKAVKDFEVDGDAAGDGRKTYSKDDIVIAVVDTGIDDDHVDLDEGKVLAFRDEVKSVPGCPSPPDDAYDDNGHGTHVASIAAGEGDGDAALEGVAPGAALVGVKALDCDGFGVEDDIVAGVEWVIDHKDEHGIDVMNLSLGGLENTDGTDVLSQAVNRAMAAGIEAVVAAGNSGPLGATVGTPGTAEFVTTVGAMADPLDGDEGLPEGFSLPFFSSRGPTGDGRVKPDIVAAGVDIAAALAGSDRGYQVQSGTSMAAPFTAGVAALMLQAGAKPPSGSTCTGCPHGVEEDSMKTPIKDLLMATAEDWGVRGADVDYGAGRLDAYRAVRAAAGKGKGKGKGPNVPDHHSGLDCIDPTQFEVWKVKASGGKWPLAVTLIVPDVENDIWGVAFLDDQGELLASGELIRSTSGALPVGTEGTIYVAVVAGTQGADYVLDVSGADQVSGPFANVGGADSSGCSGLVPKGYRLAGWDGSVYSLGGAEFHGAASGLGRVGRGVEIVSHPDGGYYVATTDGGVYAFGGAPFLGSAAPIPHDGIIDMIVNRQGTGYALVSRTGGVYTFGDFAYAGSASDGEGETGRIVAALADPLEDSYYLVSNDGSVHGFGDFAELPELVGDASDVPHSGITDAAITGSGSGYGLVSWTGDIYAFGDFPFLGPDADMEIVGQIEGIDLTPTGNGYYLFTSDGAVYAFGDAEFHGAITDVPHAGIVAAAL